MDVIYLDHAASTPVDPEVADAMAGCLRSTGDFANPSAEHVPGRRARALVEQARAEVAALIGAAPGEIVFTSGATEANNLAVAGIARFHRSRGRHLVTGVTEHASVRDAFRALEREGYTVTFLPCDHTGVIAPEAVAAALRPDTTLVSLMHANNEIATLHDVAAIAAVCRERGVFCHTDAVQSLGREAIDVGRLPVDAMSLSAHKMQGPKGVGALYLRRATLPRIEPLLHGGDQERRLRPGTLPTHQFVGFGRTAVLAARRLADDPPRIRALRDDLWRRLAALPGVGRNGHAERAVCHILNVTVQGVEGESLVHALELAGLAVARGAACTAEHATPSPVLRALGRSEHEAQSSLRLSLGRGTTGAQVGQAAAIIARTVQALRHIAPAATAG